MPLPRPCSGNGANPEGRIENAITGARWQRRITETLFKSLTPDEAFRAMLSLYMANQKNNKPLHEWTLSP